MKPKIQILIFILIFISCRNSINNDNERNVEEIKLDVKTQNLEFLFKKGFSKLDTLDFFLDKLLVGKRSSLEGFKSLNIKGHRFYELDENGNIIRESDISNNYSVYAYDGKNRLIKSENKQHNPPKIYHQVKYKYSNDVVTEIIKTSYEDNKQSKREVLKDSLALNNSFFVNKEKTDFLISVNKDKIITYDSEMIFCCGVTMKGQNKLTYYINKNELIDSLIIEGLENSERMKFEYQYQ